MLSDFFYPDIEVDIADYTFTKGIEIEAVSDKNSYFDFAKVKFTRRFKEKISLKKYDPIKIKIGYAGDLVEIFSGYLSKSGSEKNQIVFKDKMIFLENSIVTNTFLDVYPQEIIKYALDKASIDDYILSKEIYSNKSKFIVSEKNSILLLNEVNTKWNISNKFFFQNGTFYWGTKAAQKYKYTFEYGKNIISLRKINFEWELITVSVPNIKHGDKFIVDHIQLSGEFEANKVIFTTDSDGFIRTKIYF